MPRELDWFRDKWPSCHKQKLPRKSSPRRRNLTPVMMGAYKQFLRKCLRRAAAAFLTQDMNNHIATFVNRHCKLFKRIDPSLN